MSYWRAVGVGVLGMATAGVTGASVLACGELAADGEAGRCAPSPANAEGTSQDAAAGPSAVAAEPSPSVSDAGSAAPDGGGAWQRPAIIHGANVYNALAHECTILHDCGQNTTKTAEECIAERAVAAIRNPAAGSCDESAVDRCLTALQAVGCPLVDPPLDCATCLGR